VNPHCPSDMCACTIGVNNDVYSNSTGNSGGVKLNTHEVLVCIGKNAISGIDQWCQHTCSNNILNCPLSMCDCVMASEGDSPIQSIQETTMTTSSTTSAPWKWSPTTTKAPVTLSTKVPLELTTKKPWHWTDEIVVKAPVKVDMKELVKEKYRFRLPTINKKPQTFKYKVRLPEGVTCDRCVLQWTYKTGNTWGYCQDGTGKVGCGPQEWFRNCGDISIKEENELNNVTKAVSRNTIYQANADGKVEPLVVDAIVCVARDEHNNKPWLNDQCQKSCLQYPPQCNLSECKCLSWCEAIGDLAGIDGTDTFCNMNCLRYPSHCPKDHCRCYES
jgi:hypothetical protein